MDSKLKKKLKDTSKLNNNGGVSEREMTRSRKRKGSVIKSTKEKKKCYTDLKNIIKEILPSFFANDKHLSNCMFNLVCDILSITKISDATFSNTKKRIFEALNILLHVRRPLSEDNNDSMFERPLEPHKSMYRNNFKEEKLIGKGGYGHVYKARHILDEVNYAVKKIAIPVNKKKQIKRSLEEVKTLAKLNHPNIVNYKYAWIEPSIAGKDDQLQPSQSSRSDSESEENGSTMSQINENLDGFHLISNIRSKHYENIVTESSEDSSEKQNHSNIILYIQMSLCQQNLREWMDLRKKESPISEVEKITKQILSGLNYIHNLIIVHHDINPKNIFIAMGPHGEMQVQLGDFGLACSRHKKVHSQDFGTPLYVAPEQRNKECDSKSDIYSFGIVLFELLFPMQSDHERIHEVQNLRRQIGPETL